MEQFGKYQMVRRVGAGGMAEVFLARISVAQGLNKQLVIKKIHPAFARSEQFLSMFVDEAKIALSLNHPNIVPIYSIANEKGVNYIAMGYISGASLKSIIERLQNNKKPHLLKIILFILR